MTDTTTKPVRTFSEIFPQEFQDAIKHHSEGDYIDYRELEKYRDFCAVNPTANTSEPAHITRQRQAQQEEILSRFTKMIETTRDIDEAHRVIAFMEDCGDPHFAGRLQLKLGDFNRAESEKNRTLKTQLTGRHGEGLSALLAKRGLPPIPIADHLPDSSREAGSSSTQQPDSLNAVEGPEREVTGASRELGSAEGTMNTSVNEPEITIDQVEDNIGTYLSPAALPDSATQPNVSLSPLGIQPKEESSEATVAEGSTAAAQPATEQFTNIEQASGPVATPVEEVKTPVAEAQISAHTIPQAETVQTPPVAASAPEAEEEPKGPMSRQEVAGTVNNLIGGVKRIMSGILGGGEIDSDTAANLHQAMYGANEDKAK